MYIPDSMNKDATKQLEQLLRSIKSCKEILIQQQKDHCERLNYLFAEFNLRVKTSEQSQANRTAKDSEKKRFILTQKEKICNFTTLLEPICQMMSFTDDVYYFSALHKELIDPEIPIDSYYFPEFHIKLQYARFMSSIGHLVQNSLPVHSLWNLILTFSMEIQICGNTPPS